MLKVVLIVIIITNLLSIIKNIVCYLNYKKYNPEIRLSSIGISAALITFPTRINLFGKDYNVYNNSAAILANKARFALVNPENSVIFCDTEFMNMSETAKKFIIEHENGHIINHHVVKKDYWLKRKLCIFGGKVLPIELEADEYAASVIGKEAARIGLKEMYSHISIFDLTNK